MECEVLSERMFLNLSSEFYTKKVHPEIVAIKCIVLLWMTHTFFFPDIGKNRAHQIVLLF